MPFGIQPIHLLIVGIVALVVFGPSKLPELGRGLGRSLTEFRKGAREMTEGFTDEFAKPSDEPRPAVTVAGASATVPMASSAQTMTQTCAKCGTSNAHDASFCNKCGNPLTNPLAA